MISVIIPVFNVEEYLHICINSVLNQTYQNFEIICVDDASTDSSLEILEYFAKKDFRVKIIKNEKNRGSGFSRNKALDIAEGKYIFFLDADDWISLNAFEILIETAEKDNVDMLLFKNIIFYQESFNFTMEEYYDMAFFNHFNLKIFNHKDLDKTNLFKIPNGSCNKLYLKSFLDEFNISFSNERLIYDDKSFFYKCFILARKISFVDEYLYNYRKKQDFILDLPYGHIFDIIKTMNLILKWFIENKKTYEYYKREILSYIFSILNNEFDKMDDNVKMRFFIEIQDFYKYFIQNYDLYVDIKENVDEHILERFNFDEIIEDLLKTKPEISVIVPVYNVRNYLNECLDSICNQSFEDIEIICVNDGSTDDSLGILKEYEQLDSRIIIISKENGGLSSARNAGLKQATGKYIYFIDSDDYLNLNALKELYEISEENDLDMLMFKLQCFKDETKEKFTTPYFEMEFMQGLVGEDIFNYKDVDNRLFDLCVTAQSTFFKHNLIFDMYFREGLIFEDTVFFAEALFKAQKVFFYNKYLYNYRFRESSITSSNFSNFSDIIEISNLLIDLTKQFSDFSKYKKILYSKKLFRIKDRFLQVPNEFKEEFFFKIQKDFLKYNEEYESDDAFQKISDELKNIFHAGLYSSNYEEFENNIINLS